MFSGYTYPIKLLGMFFDLTGSEISKMADSKAGSTYISAVHLLLVNIMY